jgi:hypothetical protein
MNDGSAFSFTPDQPVLSPAPESPSSLFNNKRQFDNAFYPSAPTNFDSPPPTSSYQSGWTNNRGSYSNNYRGGRGGGGYSRFPKRSRPYNYQN